MKLKANSKIENGNIGDYLCISDKRQRELMDKVFDRIVFEKMSFHESLEMSADVAKSNEELYFIAFNMSMFMSKFGRLTDKNDELDKKLDRELVVLFVLVELA